MALLNRESVLAATDTRTEVVSVPEWGGEVIVRGLSGTELEKFESSITSTKGKPVLDHVRARLCQLAIVGEDGRPMFKPHDVVALGAKSAVALNRVFDVARRLSGMTKEEVEEIAKNSEETPG